MASAVIAFFLVLLIGAAFAVTALLRGKAMADVARFGSHDDCD